MLVSKIAILKKVFTCVVLKRIVYVRNVISFFYKPKSDEILTFLAKF